MFFEAITAAFTFTPGTSCGNPRATGSSEMAGVYAELGADSKGQVAGSIGANGGFSLSGEGFTLLKVGSGGFADVSGKTAEVS